MKLVFILLNMFMRYIAIDEYIAEAHSFFTATFYDMV